MSKLSKKKVIGITGSMGSGKSEISRYLRKMLKEQTGKEIFGLTFTVFSNGNIKIEYKYDGSII